MPGTILELHDSRTFSVDITGGSAEFKYVLYGESDEVAAYDLVLNTSPGTWNQYTRSTIDMTNRPSLSLWFPVVKYSLPVFSEDSMGSGGGASGTETPPPSPSSSSPANTTVLDGVSVSIALENQHVTKSVESIARHGLGGVVPPDFKGLIGVTSDGKVDGVDIGVPVANIVYKKTLPALTAGYFKDLLYMAGKTNKNAWWIFKSEEGLFAGANGQQKESGEFEVNYEFKYSPTKEDILIREDNGGLTVTEKKGWHYLWVASKPEKDTVANALIERPFAAYVERVYETVDYNWLGI